MGFKEEAGRERGRIKAVGFPKEEEERLLSELAEKEKHFDAVQAKLKEAEDGVPGAAVSRYSALQRDAVLGKVKGVDDKPAAGTVQRSAPEGDKDDTPVNERGEPIPPAAPAGKVTATAVPRSSPPTSPPKAGR